MEFVLEIRGNSMHEHKIYKVLQVGMTSNIGGIETYLMEQYKNLDKSRIQYDFVNVKGESKMAFTDYILIHGNHVYDFPSRRHHPLKHYAAWMHFFLQHHGEYDAVVLNTCSLTYMFPLFAAWIFKIKRRIIHSHNSGDELRVNLVRKFIAWVNRYLMKMSATDYWACSDLAGRWMFGNRNFEIIYNAIDMESFRYNHETRIQKRRELHLDHAFVVGHVGRFSYAKNHTFLIDIFHEIQGIHPDSVLLLVGNYHVDEAYTQDILKKIQQYHMNESVKLLGSRNDVPQLMQAMDCFVLPSLFEGFPMVGVEAQTTGLKCFFSDTITRSATITPLVHYLSLAQSPLSWGKSIYENSHIQDYDRNQFYNSINNKFNIQAEINIIEELYTKGK